MTDDQIDNLYQQINTLTQLVNNQNERIKEQDDRIRELKSEMLKRDMLESQRVNWPRLTPDPVYYGLDVATATGSTAKLEDALSIRAEGFTAQEKFDQQTLDLAAQIGDPKYG